MKFFSNIGNWFEKQWRWVKSFLSEKELVDGELVGSSKRVATITVIYLFAHTIINVGEGTQWKAVPPISWEWAVLIGGILGINVWDAYKKKQMKNGG